MLVTPSGIAMLVRLLQPENAEFPMPVTLSGIVMLVKLLQPENAEFPMLVTPSVKTTSFMAASLIPHLLYPLIPAPDTIRSVTSPKLSQ